MAIDFPQFPALNELYAYGSRSWIWDGSKWNLNSSVVGSSVTALNGLSGGVTLSAGSGITLSTSGNTITLSSGSGTQGAQGIQGTSGVGTQGAQGTQGIPGATGIGSGYTAAEIRSNYLYVVKIFPDGSTAEINLGFIGPTGSGFVFDADLTAAFGSGKYFGKYVQGDSIPAMGKTAVDVIKDALVAALTPTISLTTPTTISLNQTSIDNVLNFSYVINSLNALVVGATLDWRRNNSGGYTALSGNTGATAFTHSLTDSAFNTKPFNYRYRVTDSFGATAQAVVNITPTYVAPTIAITLVGPNTTSPETAIRREKGNVASNISAVITRNSQYVDLQSWQLQYQENGAGSYIDVETPTSISGSSASTGTIPHLTTNTVSSARYRIKVIDQHQTSTNDSSTINYYNYIFYGATASVSSTSANVRSLPVRQLSADLGNPFNLDSGTQYITYTVAFPGNTLTEVFDLEASVNITSQYDDSVISVLDYAGNATTYNAYTLTLSFPYTDNHRHRITRST
jgi:hypothetical protein